MQERVIFQNNSCSINTVFYTGVAYRCFLLHRYYNKDVPMEKSVNDISEYENQLKSDQWKRAFADSQQSQTSRV